MDPHYLVGAEEVSRAASTMLHAAREMQSAANSLQWSLEQHRLWMDDWLARFQAVMQEGK